MNILNNKRSSLVGDSVILTFVRIITIMVGFAISKILASKLSLTEYGTYSQGLLIVSTVTSITILGLSDAINYYYNSKPDEEKEHYLNTILGIQYFIGIVSAILICIFSSLIIRFFDNNDLKIILLICAWIPLMNNLMAMLQVLFVSTGRLKSIAIKNLIISILKLVLVIISCYVFENILCIFIFELISDVAIVIYFYFSLKKNCSFNVFKLFNKHKVKEILNFSLPMAVFVITNSFLRDTDKYVIEYFYGAEELAIYTNASKILPFDIISTSFITILVAIFPKLLSKKDYSKSFELFKEYIFVAITTSWVFIIAAILNYQELFVFLYHEKYVVGSKIFLIYLLSDLLKFGNISIILSAKGKTKTLMIVSIILLIINLLLNILFCKLFGNYGPAIATVIVVLINSIISLTLSAKELNNKFINLFNEKRTIYFIFVSCVIFGILYLIKFFIFKNISLPNLIMLLIFSGLYVVLVLLICKNKIIDSFRIINRYKIGENND